MKNLLILIMLAVVIAAGCRSVEEQVSSPAHKISEVEFSTVDGWLIKGTLYENNGSSLLLLHMLGKDRNDWDGLARVLQNKGYNVLAIDLRGHGRSMLNGEKKRWMGFSELDFNSMTRDVEAAQDFLNDENITIIGASIGANVAVKYAANNKVVGGLILLSPGEDYRGVESKDAMRQVKQPVFIAASEEDGYSASSSRTLAELSSGKSELKMLSNAGHGTAMLSGTFLEKEIIAWLQANFPVEKTRANMTKADVVS